MKGEQLKEWNFRTGQVDEVLSTALRLQESCFEQIVNKNSVHGSTIRDYLVSAQIVTTAFELCGIYYPPGQNEATVWTGGSGFGVRHLPAQRTFKDPKFQNDDLWDILSADLSSNDYNQLTSDITASLQLLKKLAQFSNAHVLDNWWKRHQALDEYRSVYLNAYAVYNVEVFDYADNLNQIKDWLAALNKEWQHFKTIGTQFFNKNPIFLSTHSESDNGRRDIILEDYFPKGEQVIRIDMADEVVAKPLFVDLPKPIKLLYMAATPARLEKINTGLETRFQDLISQYDRSDKIDFKQEHGLSKENFRNILYTQDPHIIHFGGHGFSEGLALEDAEIDANVLVELVGMLRNTQIVVLNACNTIHMAKKMAQFVPYVIGTQGPLSDDSAIAFARSFYVGIASGKDIEGSFHFGLNGIKDLGKRDYNIPVLVIGNNKSNVGWSKPILNPEIKVPPIDIPVLVSNGMLREALDHLENIAVSNDDLNLVFQVKGQLSQLERDIICETISETTVNITRAKIRQAILSLYNQKKG